MEIEIDQLTEDAEQCYDMSYDFISRIGFPKCEGCIPQQTEKWMGIIQAISDFSGYNLALRVEVNTVQGPKTEEYKPVYQDVLTASPSCLSLRMRASALSTSMPKTRVGNSRFYAGESIRVTDGSSFGGLAVV